MYSLIKCETERKSLNWNIKYMVLTERWERHISILTEILKKEKKTVFLIDLIYRLIFSFAVCLVMWLKNALFLKGKLMLSLKHEGECQLQYMANLRFIPQQDPTRGL